MKKYLLIGLLIFVPFLTKADTTVFGFMNGNFYDVNGSLKYACLEDGNCYNYETKAMTTLSQILGLSTSTPQTITVVTGSPSPTPTPQIIYIPIPVSPTPTPDLALIPQSVPTPSPIPTPIPTPSCRVPTYSDGFYDYGSGAGSGPYSSLTVACDDKPSSFDLTFSFPTNRNFPETARTFALDDMNMNTLVPFTTITPNQSFTYHVVNSSSTGGFQFMLSGNVLDITINNIIWSN